MTKILSLNVNGIRAAERKGFLTWLQKESPDFICLQETKVHDPEILSDELLKPKGYNAFWNCAIERKGWSGVVIYSKQKPIQIKVKFGSKILSKEGRMILAEYNKYYLINIYFPNAGRGKDRLDYKLRFYSEFTKYIKRLDKKKPVIFCGDVNTAHNEIDLARPKDNINNTGFLPIERSWIDKWVDNNFIDTFRTLHPNAKDQYSWWDMKTRSRERNVGWRLDYFFISKRLKKHLKKAFIMQEVIGSDHCPVGILLNN